VDRIAISLMNLPEQPDARGEIIGPPRPDQDICDEGHVGQRHPVSLARTLAEPA
jgi:hypothetical protein